MLIQLEQAKLSLRDLEAGINDLKASIKFDTLQQEVADLELKTGEAGFWDDPQESQKVLKLLKVKKSLLENYLHLRRAFDDIAVLIRAVDIPDLVMIHPDMTALDKALTLFADRYLWVASVHDFLLSTAGFISIIDDISRIYTAIIS